MIRRQVPLSVNLTPLAACFLTCIAWASSLMAVEVTATRLDGASVVGELRAWNTDELKLATSNGDQQIPTNQLASLRWSSTPAPADSAIGAVELMDGTVLPIKTIHVDKSQARLTLAAQARDKPLELPISQISLIRLRQLEGPLATQWDEIHRQKLASDAIVVLKKDGKSLDYVEGVIGDIGDDKIEFKLDGENQRVDRAKIAGAIYYRPDRRLKEEPKASIQGRSGFRASVARIELKDSVLELTTAAGVRLSWPIQDISLADFSAGKLLYLSDIDPVSSNSTPFVGRSPGAKLAAQYEHFRRDKSVFGGPLSLMMKGDDAAATQPTPRPYAKGLSLRSRTEIVYRLPPGFQRFITIAGIDPATRIAGNVRLAILGDDRVLLETDITGNDAPQPIQLDIADVKRLKIVVDYGQNFDTGDWLNLCDARIAK